MLKCELLFRSVFYFIFSNFIESIDIFGMEKKYKVTETKTDFWGNKKYIVTEESSGVDLSKLGFIILLLVILALPSGIFYLITFILYPILFPYKNNNIPESNSFEDWKEKVIKNSFYISFLLCILYYIYIYYSYQNIKEQLWSDYDWFAEKMVTDEFNKSVINIIRKSFIGVICYIVAGLLLMNESYWNKYKKSN